MVDEAADDGRDASSELSADSRASLIGKWGAGFGVDGIAQRQQQQTATTRGNNDNKKTTSTVDNNKKQQAATTRGNNTQASGLLDGRAKVVVGISQRRGRLHADFQVVRSGPAGIPLHTHKE